MTLKDIHNIFLIPFILSQEIKSQAIITKYK